MRFTGDLGSVMHEDDMKAEVLGWVRRACRSRALPVVASEFSLNGTGVRADLAVLYGSFYGIEIKSAADTLKRLPSQMEGYARYFDRTVLVVDAKHLRGLRSLELKGAQVRSRSGLSGQQLRKRGERASVCGHTLLGLLTAEEERRAMRAMDAAAAAAPPGQDLARMEFEKAFRRRYQATSDAFWEAMQGRRIVGNDIALLSRFLPERERVREARVQQEADWSAWVARMAAVSLTLGQPAQSSSVS